MPLERTIEPIRQGIYRLSLPSEKQISHLYDIGLISRDDIRFSDPIDELADEFLEDMVSVTTNLDPTELKDSMPGLAKLHEFMDRVLADENMYTVQALKNSPEWDVIRELAEKALCDPGLSRSV